MNKKNWIAALLLIAAGVAQADEIHYGIDIYGKSLHTMPAPSSKGWNQINYGLGGRIVYQPESWAEVAVQAGGWYNSFRDAAYYVGYRATVAPVPWLHVGVDTRAWDSRSYAATPFNYQTVELGSGPTRLAILHLGKGGGGVTMFYVKHDF